MQYSKQRDERRRRVLTDDLTGSTASLPADPTPETPASGLPRTRKRCDSSKYGECGFAHGQPRISDLVPQSFLTIGLLFVFGLSLIAGLEALHFYTPQLLPEGANRRIKSFDLRAEGSVAVWLSSVMLGLASLTSLLIFSVRRHKSDDYHGRYRAWLWASVLWLFMSIDATGGLHHTFKEWMSRLAGTPILGDGSIWWVLGYALAWLAVAGRLIFQLAACRSATVVFLAAGGCFISTVAVQAEWIAPPVGLPAIMLEEGLEMVGELFLFLSTVLFARFAILESQGEVGTKAAKPKVSRRRKSLATSAVPAGEGRSGEAKTSSTSSTHASGLVSRESQLRFDSAHPAPDRRLSKAERRALRRQ